jgi:hypothetical protein
MDYFGPNATLISVVVCGHDSQCYRVGNQGFFSASAPDAPSLLTVTLTLFSSINC